MPVELDLDNQILESHKKSLNLLCCNTEDFQPPFKRRRLEPQGLLPEIVQQLCALLGAPTGTDLDGLRQAAQHFSALDESGRFKVIRLLGLIPCASAGTLSFTRDRNGEIAASECAVCDAAAPAPHPTHDAAVEAQAINVFSAVIKAPAFDSTRRARILAMVALRKYALHFDAPPFLDLEESALGQWCLSSLRSTVRELRIAAGRTLPAFLRDTPHHELAQKNRVNALNLLKHFSEQSPMNLTETWVLAWGQVARASRDRELNLALLRLVEYLGHSNQLVSAVAFNELLNTAEAHAIRPEQLFDPFWRTIAHTAVKDLHSRPQIAQLLAELLGVGVADFLVATQAHTLPWLVLDAQTDVVARISQARGDADAHQAVLDNMATVLPLLLVQGVRDVRGFVMEALKRVSPDFGVLDLGDCLKMELIKIAVELLKNSGDGNGKKSKVGCILLS